MVNVYVLWQPYVGEVVDQLPDICLADQEIWRTMSPLICFDTVEWHRPERVLRQFGLHRRYLQLALTSISYIESMHAGDTSAIGRHIMLCT